MPVTETIAVSVECDNPDCPGNELDPSDRTGWTIVTTTIAGPAMLAVAEYVYCRADCAASIAVPLAEAELERAAVPKLEDEA